MASEWSGVPLEESVADILDRRGITPKKLGSTFVPAGYRVISAKAIKGHRVDLSADEPRFVNEATYRKWMRTPLLADDVILTSEAPLGEPAYVARDAEWCLGQRLFGIRTNKDKLYGRYLFYALQSSEVRHDLLSRATGTTAQGIRQAELRRVLIPLPALPEQRAIAHILGTLDDKIELNRRMNQTLEEMARALFKSWFVDFDPVRAKAALKQQALQQHAARAEESSGDGAAPADEWTVERACAYLAGMDPQITDLLPDRLVATELGEIPERWETRTLGNIADVNPESWSRTNIPDCLEYVALANTNWGVIESTQHFPSSDAPSRARRVLRTGDTIVGTVRPGNGSYAFVGSDGLTGSTGFAVLRPLNPQFRELVYLAATAKDNIERLAHRADGAAYPAVRPEVVATTEFTAPSAEPEVLLAFSKCVGPILERIESIKTETEIVAAQREALLPNLVSGVVSVIGPEGVEANTSGLSGNNSICIHGCIAAHPEGSGFND